MDLGKTFLCEMYSLYDTFVDMYLFGSFFVIHCRVWTQELEEVLTLHILLKSIKIDFIEFAPKVLYLI